MNNESNKRAASFLISPPRDRIRVLNVGVTLDGASDHGVSEALYLRDADGNGVELYWDRPQDQWPRTPEGDLDMYTRALDVGALLAEAP